MDLAALLYSFMNTNRNRWVGRAPPLTKAEIEASLPAALVEWDGSVRRRTRSSSGGAQSTQGKRHELLLASLAFPSWREFTGSGGISYQRGLTRRHGALRRLETAILKEKELGEEFDCVPIGAEEAVLFDLWERWKAKVIEETRSLTTRSEVAVGDKELRLASLFGARVAAARWPSKNGCVSLSYGER